MPAAKFEEEGDEELEGEEFNNSECVFTAAAVKVDNLDNGISCFIAKFACFCC